MRAQNFRVKKNNKDEEVVELYIREALGVGVTAVVLFMAIMLFSYHPQDTSPFHFDSDLFFVRNWGGIVGAYLSSILFHLLGAAAYMLVGALSVIAYMLFFGHRQQRSWLSLSLLPVCVFATAGLAGLYGFDFVHGEPGGELGFFVASYLTKFLGFYGAVVLSWAVLWVSLVVVLRVSFVRGIVSAGKFIASSRAAFFF